MAQNPWEMNWSGQQPTTGAPSGPVYGAPPKPDKPNEPKTTWREDVRNGVRVLVSSEGDVKAMPGGDEDPKGASRIATLESIVPQINRVQELYAAGIRDESLWNAFGLLDGVGPEAGRFDSAGSGLADQGLAAFRVPGVGSQSDFEAKQFAEANKPQAGNWDAAIEEKLRNLRGRVDANRKAAGLPPANWTGLEDSPAKEPPPLMQPGMPGASGGGSQPMAPAGGGMRAVNDPNLANELFAMLNAGRSIDEISAYAQSKGAAPIIPNAETLDYARKNPGWNPFTANRYEPVSDFERTATAIGGSAPGAYAIGAGQFLSGNTLDNLQADPERARLSMDLAAQQSPTATTLGEVSGGVIGSLAGEAMLARLGAPGGVIRSFAADAGYGAANGAGMADNPGQNRGTNALFGAALAAGGNAAGRAAGQGVNALARGVRDPATRQMMNEVGDLTVGQTYGQSGRVGAAVKGVEDRLSGLPVVGDSVNAARAKTVQNFNAKAFDKALEPIGQKLNGEVGQDAVANAQAKVQQAFQDALAGRSVQADASFANEMTQATTKVMAIRRVGPELSEQVADILGPHMQQGKNNLTGEEMQIISQELRNLKAAYKKSEPAFYKKIGEAIDSTENAVFGLFKRQAPDVVPKYNAAKQAYRRVSILADATLKGKNQPDSMFTPAQLNTADAANAKKYEGAMSAASGPRQFREFGEAGQAVLPNKVPDSGTAGRLVLGAAGAGGIIGTGGGAVAGDPGTGAAYGTGTGLALSAILLGAYSKAGQRVLTKPGRGSQRLADPRLQQLLGKIGAATGAASLPGTTPSQ
jgi:hypothetical protein